jgi:two-component system response regulator
MIRKILIAEDDEEDQMLLEEAFKEVDASIELSFVSNGETLIQTLNNIQIHCAWHELPSIILLDLNMPRMDGRQALNEIKQLKEPLNVLPIIVFSTSKSFDDIQFCYKNGVNSFIKKPSSYSELKDIVKIVSDYWFGKIILPEYISTPDL